MRIGIVAAGLLFMSIPSAEAGECSCKTEIDNATAKTTDSCGKIWNENHCTLKESSVSSANQSSWQSILDEVDTAIPLALDLPQSVDILKLDPERVRSVVNVRILNLLQGVVPAGFAADVLDTLNSGDATGKMQMLAQQNTVQRLSEPFGVPIAISNLCIYGGDRATNFYLNLKPGNEPCPVQELADALR